MDWVRLLPRGLGVSVAQRLVARRPGHVAVLLFGGAILGDAEAMASFVALVGRCYARTEGSRVMVALDFEREWLSAGEAVVEALRLRGVEPLVFGREGVCEIGAAAGEARLFRVNPGAQGVIAEGLRSRSSLLLIPQPFFCAARAGRVAILPFARIAARGECRLDAIVRRPISASPFSFVPVPSAGAVAGEIPDSTYTLY